MGDQILRVKPLTAVAFAPFGEVIEAAGHEPIWINERTSQRYNDLARVDVQEAEGTPLISIFRAQPRAMPFVVKNLERHPLSSQAFYPLERRPFLVMVAEQASELRFEHLHAFLASGFQGVNYRRNCWHHSLIALEQPCDFLVIDRGGPEENCEEQTLAGERVLVRLP